MKIIRLGGSLFSEYDILRKLSAFFQRWDGEGLLLVPGGGPYARLIKQHQEEKGFTESQAHWMAIKSTEIMGVLLCDLIPKAIQIAVPKLIPGGEIAVIFAYAYFKTRDLLPHSWDATSDAIATYIGLDLGVKQFYKITSGPEDPKLALDAITRESANDFGIKWTIISTQNAAFIKHLENAL
ncbi:MAG: hypothetical protein ACFFGZ_05125 [Candidatus Thorarchaeota archaeon]